ncbi:GGDEF and EAL domain-containing protein [Photobacterium galatheae]|uniref:cyclic-guanylate-specific phosphodiesterase n=1 Tax=Photobacterium galatheae TaxID=1654360 RepID=A0A066RVV8_9GAMM|nr:GGDEF and EAL domain-containing protein [Photobacterium galatheae]KDM91832.1 c-di-GMP phosphodiesterase [Photobacterium galatheae]MCM0147758.1 EAL domain-containing protein [Photobacterium galatheae]
MPTEFINNWFFQLTGNSPFLFAILDKHHCYTAVNQHYSQLSGLNCEELVGCTDADILGQGFYESLKPYYERAFKGECVEGDIILDEHRHHTSLHFSLSPLRNETAEITHVVLHAIDTSERLQLANAVAEREDQFNQLCQLMADGCLLIEKNQILSANAVAAQLLGFSSTEAIIGEDLGQLLIDSRNNRPFGEQLAELSRGKTYHCLTSPQCQTEHALTLTQGDIQLVGSPASLVVLKQPQKQQVHPDQVEQLIHTDPLTGLYNRHGFSRRLEQMISRQIPLVMLYLDIDNFKNINDSLGHHIGDRVLQEISHRLRQLLPENAVIGHLGGDEFGILLPEPVQTDMGEQVSKKIIALVNQPFDLMHFSKHLACSIGMVNYPGNGSDARLLLQHADTAMYEAKNRGRNRLVTFDETMNKEARMRLWLEIELQKALQNKGLEVWYQPKVSARDFSIHGAEALVRWKHPIEGYISPAQFIPVAERSGLIEQLGKVVMREVFTTVKRWKKQGLLPGRVAINLSPQQFGNPNLIQYVSDLQRTTEVNPDDITFELTESAMMGENEHTIQMLNAIKKLGFALSIDDFGTGYSSLSYLARFPLDELKIDRAFIKDLETIPKQLTLIENIINLGKSLNMCVVAEGVETRQQAALLSNLNCDYIQGFHFFRPLPKNDLETILLKNFRTRY